MCVYIYTYSEREISFIDNHKVTEGLMWPALAGG